MRALPGFLERLHEHITIPAEARYWSQLFRMTREGRIDTWDYQWQFAVMRTYGLTIVPNANLVSNIGFGPNATHTKDSNGRGAVMPVRALGALRHPSDTTCNELADQHYFRIMHHRSFARRARDYLARGWRAFRRWRTRVQLSGGW
jgi:hypothetical protein